MTVRQTPFAINEYYHLYSRGVDKRKIFLNEEDERRFVRLLYLCNGTKPIVYRGVRDTPLPLVNKGEAQVAIGSFCLMPNHFHLLVKEIKEGGTTRFMRKLLTAYSSYFNKRYERTGALFGSEFRSAHLNSDEYLKYIFSYIHLNPLKILDSDWRSKAIDPYKAEKFLNTYYGSSYLDYAFNGREESCVLSKLAFPEYFPSEEEFKNNIFDWLSTAYIGEGLENCG
jgi:putative transposase